MLSDNNSTQQVVLATLRLISPVCAMNVAKTRVGGPADGGYVMLDDLDRIGVCYSLGVGPDVSWDLDMARRGSLIYQYDHTVQAAPSSHPHFKHYQVGITHDDTLSTNLKRLDTLMQDNGHMSRHDMFLKIDIEGHEWDSLDALDTSIFAKFRQIVVEFHGLRMLGIESFRVRAMSTFAKLREHHEVVHVHGNNFAGMAIVEGIPVADCIELSYASRRHYSFCKSDEVFPGTLDTPNKEGVADIFLGSFKF